MSNRQLQEDNQLGGVLYPLDSDRSEKVFIKSSSRTNKYDMSVQSPTSLQLEKIEE